MIKQIKRAMFFSLMVLGITACGGGGDTASTPTTPAPQNTVYTKAIIKINLGGDLGGKAIAGAGFTLVLPNNIIPELVNNIVASTVVTPTGIFAGGTQTPPVYSAATASTPGTVQIALANSVATGVTTVGEVATITLQLLNGAVPVAADFTLNSVPVNVIDIFGNSVGGMAAVVAGVTLQ
jgi:hypothetical protein